jgi:hypothetical protein
MVNEPMKSSLTPIIVMLFVLTAGCMFGPSERASTLTSTTKHPDITEKPVPETPPNLTQENVVPFAKEFEKAYEWNQELTNRTVNLSVAIIEESLVNTTDSGYVVRLEAESFHTNGNRLADDDFYTVYYFINSTTIYRFKVHSVESTPDPMNGERVRSNATG